MVRLKPEWGYSGLKIMVRLAGLEPVTPTMSRWCSNQLSYSRVNGVHSIGKRNLVQYAFGRMLLF